MSPATDRGWPAAPPPTASASSIVRTTRVPRALASDALKIVWFFPTTATTPPVNPRRFCPPVLLNLGVLPLRKDYCGEN
jgi:hypothetical protein